MYRSEVIEYACELQDIQDTEVYNYPNVDVGQEVKFNSLLGFNSLVTHSSLSDSTYTYDYAINTNSYLQIELENIDGYKGIIKSIGISSHKGGLVWEN